MQELKNLYIEENFHSVIIDTIRTKGELEYSENLIFLIQEGKKYKIKKIIFNGNYIFSDNVLIKQFDETKIKKWYLPW